MRTGLSTGPCQLFTDRRSLVRLGGNKIGRAGEMYWTCIDVRLTWRTARDGPLSAPNTCLTITPAGLPDHRRETPACRRCVLILAGWRWRHWGSPVARDLSADSGGINC
jgi:hypothetical protein